MSRCACVVPGSFDPVTMGHLDIIERSARLFDRVIVGVLVNSQKKNLLTIEQRAELLEKSCAHLPNVQVGWFEGLLVEYARKSNATAIIRGLRAVSDYEYEGQLAAMNRRLAPEIETLFFMTDVRYGYLSSSMVKEICSLKGEIAGLVPDAVLDDIRALCSPTGMMLDPRGMS